MINSDFSNAFTKPKKAYSVQLPDEIMDAVKAEGKSKGMGRDAHLLTILINHFETARKTDQGKLDV